MRFGSQLGQNRQNTSLVVWNTCRVINALLFIILQYRWEIQLNLT